MNKILSKISTWIANNLVLWVILLGIIGYISPQVLIIFRPYLDWFFIFTMFGIGLTLDFTGFIPIIKKPQIVLLGTFAQFLIMPFLGFFIGKLLRVNRDLFIGLVITGSVPGAMASNVISYLAGADVVYSVALTTTSTFLSPVLTPSLVYLLAGSLIKINLGQMVLSIVKLVILPLILAMMLRRYLKDKIQPIEKIFPAFSSIFIAFICGLVVALNRDYLTHISLVLFLAVFLHNLLGLILGYLAGVVYKFSKEQIRTLAIEIGMQNAGLGAVLALKHFSTSSALPSALFASWCVVTASFLAKLWRSNKCLKNS